MESHGLTRNFADKRVARGSWQRMLPGVYLTRAGERNRRQMLVASSLYGGPSSAVDGVDALRWHGYDGPEGSGHQLHIVVPWGQSVRSKNFVVVRRALAEITVAGQGCVPYVDAATAAIVAARNARHFGAAVAVLSRSLQLGLVTVDTLRLARESIGDKWCRPVDGALETVGVGVRSPAESDLRKLIRTSPVLPEPQWNVWLDLGDGGR